MSNVIENKEALRKAIRDQIAKQVAEAVLPQYPEISYVYYNPNVEYSDEDYEYFASKLSYVTDEGEDIDLHQMAYGEVEEGGYYEKIEAISNLIENVIDDRDFAFAFGFEAHRIDFRPFK